MPLKLHTVALGCQMSAADAAEMSVPLTQRGFRQVAEPDDADAILISTCTVRQHAEDRAVSLIGSLGPWKERDPRRLLIVAGCAAERLGGWLKIRFPHVDLVVGAKSIADFPELAERALAERFDGLAEHADASPAANASPDGRGDGSLALAAPVDNGFLETGSTATAFVTVMRGCNYSCSYCIVPSVRGRELYRPASDVVEEAARRVAAGAAEITLLGQTVNSYRSEHGDAAVRFPELLGLVDAGARPARLRFMSPHPHFVDEAMLDAMARTPSACELLHLPVQSGSDRLLKLMRRNYTRASFMAKSELARRKIGGVVFSTDIIVGFPSETDEDFEQTLSLVRELSPVSAYCFKYSPREGTASAQWPDDVPQSAKEDRLRRLNDLVDSLTQKALRERIGRRLEVLVEQPGFGRSRDGFKVRWDGPGEPGRLRTLRVTAARRRTLVGECDD